MSIFFRFDCIKGKLFDKRLEASGGEKMKQLILVERVKIKRVKVKRVKD